MIYIKGSLPTTVSAPREGRNSVPNPKKAVVFPAMTIHEILPDTATLHAHPPIRRDDKSLLVLTLPQTSTGKCGDKTFHQNAESNLVFEAYDKHDDPTRHLKLGKSTRLTTQDFEKQRAAIMHSNKKATEVYIHDVESDFNFTSLAYVLGFIQARTAFGQVVNLSDVKATLMLMEDSAYTLRASELVVTNSMFKDALELATLCQILPLVGVAQVRLATPTLYTINRTVLAGRDLGAYAAKLLVLILGTANELNSGSHHCAAMFRGMVAAVKLRSHSDEGGFMRDLLTKYESGVPRGVLTVTNYSFMGLTANRYPAANLVRDTLAIYLSCVGACVAADPGASVNDYNVPGLMIRSRDIGTRPSDWVSLQMRTDDWYVIFLTKLNKTFDFLEHSIVDAACNSFFFELDTPNRHLRDVAIVPFMWVDPSTVCSQKVGPTYTYVPVGGGSTTLPLWPGRVTASSVYNKDSNGLVMSGSVTWLTMKNISIRAIGAFYLFGSQFNRLDGLAQYMFMRDGIDNGYAVLPAYVGADSTSLSNAAWYCWDTCNPNPLCGLVGDVPVLIKHVAVIPKITMQVGQENNPVTLSSGVFYVNKHYHPGARKLNPRYVPNHMRTEINRLDPYGNGPAARYDELLTSIPPVDGLPRGGDGIDEPPEVDALDDPEYVEGDGDRQEEEGTGPRYAQPAGMRGTRPRIPRTAPEDDAVDPAEYHHAASDDEVSPDEDAGIAEPGVAEEAGAPEPMNDDMSDGGPETGARYTPTKAVRQIRGFAQPKEVCVEPRRTSMDVPQAQLPAAGAAGTARESISRPKSPDSRASTPPVYRAPERFINGDEWNFMIAVSAADTPEVEFKLPPGHTWGQSLSSSVMPTAEAELKLRSEAMDQRVHDWANQVGRQNLQKVYQEFGRKIYTVCRMFGEPVTMSERDMRAHLKTYLALEGQEGRLYKGVLAKMSGMGAAKAQRHA